MNNFKNIQEFSRTLENTQGQQDVFQESRTLTRFDSKLKVNRWRSRTSGNLSQSIVELNLSCIQK